MCKKIFSYGDNGWEMDEEAMSLQVELNAGITPMTIRDRNMLLQMTEDMQGDMLIIGNNLTKAVASLVSEKKISARFESMMMERNERYQSTRFDLAYAMNQVVDLEERIDVYELTFIEADLLQKKEEKKMKKLKNKVKNQQETISDILGQKGGMAVKLEAIAKVIGKKKKVTAKSQDKTPKQKTSKPKVKAKKPTKAKKTSTKKKSSKKKS